MRQQSQEFSRVTVERSLLLSRDDGLPREGLLAGLLGVLPLRCKLRVQGCGGEAEGAEPQSVLAKPGGAVLVSYYTTAACHMPGLG